MAPKKEKQPITSRDQVVEIIKSLKKEENREKIKNYLREQQELIVFFVLTLRQIAGFFGIMIKYFGPWFVLIALLVWLGVTFF